MGPGKGSSRSNADTNEELGKSKDGVTIWPGRKEGFSTWIEEVGVACLPKGDRVGRLFRGEDIEINKDNLDEECRKDLAALYVTNSTQAVRLAKDKLFKSLEVQRARLAGDKEKLYVILYMSTSGSARAKIKEFEKKPFACLL
jgi:hypothetical protein